MLNILNKSFQKAYEPVKSPPKTNNTLISTSVIENRFFLRTKFGDCLDIILRPVNVSGTEGMFFLCDGLCDGLRVNLNAINPILSANNLPDDPVEKFKMLRESIVTEGDIHEVVNMNDAMNDAMAGFLIFFLDGVDKALSFSLQGFQTRSVEDPETETQERGSREGFVENFKTNMSLIRRRLRTTDLRFEPIDVGTVSKTKVVLCYLGDRIDEELLNEVKLRLDSAQIETVLASGFLQSYLDSHKVELFSGVGVTERPDVMCSKIAEGKVGLIIDNTPFCLYVPHVFSENIQSFDDYAKKPYYATFIRILKNLSFFLCFLLPGLYVAIGTYHQEIFPEDMLYQILSAELKTPLPIMIEALTIHVIFEVMREAGLRMPKTVGQAVSIVGAIVIGDAAVTAGLIATPMLIVVALTAITSFVVPSIYEPVAILRFAFIIIGGTLGMYGIFLALSVLLVSVCALNPYGVPYTAPLLPLTLAGMRDFVFRSKWQKLGKRVLRTTKLNS